MAGLAAGAPGGLDDACEVARAAFAASLRQAPTSYPIDVDRSLEHPAAQLSSKLGAALGLTTAETSSFQSDKRTPDYWSPKSCKWSGTPFRKPDGPFLMRFGLGAPLFASDYNLALVTISEGHSLWAGQGDICAVRRRSGGWSATCVSNWIS